MKAIGITCGIGSMLVGARAAGFQVAGNVEWRTYYHDEDAHGRNTFKENFPGAAFPEQMTDEEFARFSNADLAMGHPECGNFSQLSVALPSRKERLLDATDIPLFVELVGKLRPRYFVMDDLPKSFLAYPMQKYAEALPQYDLFPEWVSNWGYGNVQKGRNRMFMLGSLKKERWAFRPSEVRHSRTVADEIGDLGQPRRGSNVPNHDPADLSKTCPWGYGMRARGSKSTWAEVRDYWADKPGGAGLKYFSQSGKVLPRIGFWKGHWDGPSHVLTGYHTIFHNKRGEPYTIRERARIQGFPDDFVFYGADLNDRGEYILDMEKRMPRQTGKAMPVQFCTYVARQVAASLQRRPFEASGLRLLKPNAHVDDAKKWYCREVGYADQKKACQSCWLSAGCDIRSKKYKIKETT